MQVWLGGSELGFVSGAQASPGKKNNNSGLSDSMMYYL